MRVLYAHLAPRLSAYSERPFIVSIIVLQNSNDREIFTRFCRAGATAPLGTASVGGDSTNIAKFGTEGLGYMGLQVLAIKVLAIAAHIQSISRRIACLHAGGKRFGKRPAPGIRMEPNTHRRLIAAGLAGALLGVSPQAAWSAQCKPHHFRAPFYVRTMGRCVFDPATLSFRGEPAEQARCLMRGMDRSRNLAPPLASLPAALAERIGTNAGLPSREALSAFLSRQDLEWDFAAYLWLPISRANDNDPSAPMARYFVIHDTSGPNFGHRAFPDEVDDSSKINNLKRFSCADGWGKAHVVINRAGGMLLNHELGIPWRETKFEQAANFSGALKGLFLHTELIQPRRAAAGRGRHNDAQSPNPAFTAAQYDRLALVYVIASVRSNRWLIPAYHAALDADIRNGHDDPLNFDPQSFADSLESLVNELKNPQEPAPRVAADAPREPPFSPIAMTDPAEAKPPAPSAMATPEASGEPPAGTRMQASEHDAALAAKPENENQAKPESKNGGERNGAAEHCQTRLIKGRGKRVCRTDVAMAGERGKYADDVRPTDRGVPRQSTGARRHAADQHARHERVKVRPGRA
jgi:hypothetical protein